MIRTVNPSDCAALADIYNHYILNTAITFEVAAVTEEEMRRRVEVVGARYPWLVFIKDGKVLGYAYANMLKDRRAYDKTVETSVYVSHDSQRHNVGTALYDALLEELSKLGIHTLIAICTLPNPPSVAFHQKFGFTQGSIPSCLPV